MGITGLLQSEFVKPYKQRRHISEFKGQTLGYDESCFLNLSFYALVEEAERVNAMVRTKNVFQLFRHHGVQLLVFRGGKRAPWKELESQKRAIAKKRLRDNQDSAQHVLDDHQQKRAKLLQEIEVRSENMTVDVEIVFVNTAPEDEEPGASADVRVQVIIRLWQPTPGDEEKQVEEKELLQLEQQIEADENDLARRTRQIINIYPEDRERHKGLCQLMKVATIDCDYEEDYEFGSSSRSGIIVGGLANDSDLLMHGCNLCYVNSLSDLLSTESFEYYPIDDILRGLKMTQEQFRQMCFAIGTDYKRSGLTGIGIKSLPQLFYEHKTLEHVIAAVNAGKQEKIDALEKKLMKFDTQIEALEEKIVTISAKKNASTKTNQDAIAKAENRIEDLKIARIKSAPDIREKITELEEKIAEYNAFLPWYNEILPKILQVHKDNTYGNIVWPTLTSADFSIAELTEFLSRKIVYSQHGHK